MILHSEWQREPEPTEIARCSCVVGICSEVGECCEDPNCEPLVEPTPAPLCDDCNRPVRDDDAGPSCGSHALHSYCSTRCRDCTDEARQVDEDARAERWES